jgi:antirestriction protein ArdC
VKLQYKEFDRAFYSPSMDFIQIPPIKNFRSSNGFYSVLFHEMTHSTGNTKRLDRFIQGPQPFGSEDYSKEELIAEMGSAMLLANCGLATETTHTNNAAYIQNWLSNIRGNAQLVVNAASKAEKAVNFIMDIKNE